MVYKHHEASLSVFAISPLSLFDLLSQNFRPLNGFFGIGRLGLFQSITQTWVVENVNPKPPLSAANSLKTIGKRSGQIIFPFHQPGFFLK